MEGDGSLSNISISRDDAFTKCDGSSSSRSVRKDDAFTVEEGGGSNRSDHIDCEILTGEDGIKVQRGFVQERKEYNQFVSHGQHDQCPIAVWELPEPMMEKFDRYVIAKERNPEEVKKILQEILERNLDTIEREEGYTFTIPDCDKKNLEYNETIAVSLLLAGRNKNRSFQHEQQRYPATRTAWAIHKIMQAIDSGISISKRNLFYSNKALYEEQKRSDEAINDLCCLTHCRRSSLNVVAAERGMIIGNILLKLINGKSVSCSIGLHIPCNPKQIVDVAVHEDSPDIKYILVVEKHTMMYHLEQMDYHNIHNCIILTGCGMPSISTREFLRFLKQRTGLPIYGLSDPDPKGAEILAVYARGSVKSAYDNFNVSVPSLRWIGFSTSDIEDYKLELPESSFSAFNDTDIKTLSSLLNDKHYQLSNEWLRKIKHMEKFKKKTSFEELERFGTRYFALHLLPQLINNASEISDLYDVKVPQDTGFSEDRIL